MVIVGSAHPPEISSFSNDHPLRCSHDVFLSFRGEDTRKNFTGHLYTAFTNAGFRTFLDDEELPRGEDIKPELEKAIKQSRSSVIVFSKDYASSRWCLDELVMIMEQKRTVNQVVLPVFYDVDPSCVRKQTGILAKSFSKHEKNRLLKDKVKRWRAALSEVADLAGMVLQNEGGNEAEFIKKVVKVIDDKLRRIPLSVSKYLVGIKYRVHDINLWLADGSTDVGILLIYGIKGIGKTTIAKFVYNSNFQRFERYSFLENIREVSEQPNGIVKLQQQLLSDILSGKKVKLRNISEGISKVEEALSTRRVFLVLDDVAHIDQFDALIRMQKRLYPGSKIIITTSCAGLLEAQRQFFSVHEVETLGHDESLELFCWHAFGQKHPDRSYRNLSRRVADHCGGLPLALKVLGSSLSGKKIAVWESALKKLEVIPNGEILEKLKISYGSLQDDHDRDIFLHIACFFIGMEKDLVVTILDGCDFFTEIGIQNLIDRGLVTIDEYTKVQMHDMIRDLGRDIVRLESKEPGERSRLWHHKDSFKVLTENKGTKAIEGLVFNMQLHHTYTSRSRESSKIVMKTSAFTVMCNLKFLKLSHVQLGGCYEDFPTGLTWMCWNNYPLASLPSDFPLERLVVLEMCCSSLRQVWRKTKNLPCLKVLNLSHSHDLTETPDFSSIPNLEILNLKDCLSLNHFDESIGELERLVYLNLEDCRSIRKLPKDISKLILLEVFVISGCSSLREFPVDMRKMESLKVFRADGVPIHQVLVTTGEVRLATRPKLGISWASYLPRNIVKLSLIECNLFDSDFPKDFGNLSSLRVLDLRANPISCLPDCIRGLSELDHLFVMRCTSLKSLEGLPQVRKYLRVEGCTSLESISYQHPLKCMMMLRDNDKIVEIEGDYKLEPIVDFDKEFVHLLGLSNLESLGTIMIGALESEHSSGWKGRGMHPVQGLYERGVFSTSLPGNEVPGQFSHRSRGSSVSFTVPVVPDREIRGLNIFFILAVSNNKDSNPINNVRNVDDLNFQTLTVVSNMSKGLQWMYGPSVYGIPSQGNDVVWLSHWKLGSQLKGGDEVAVITHSHSNFEVKECGLHLVYHEHNDKIITGTELKSIDVPWYLKPEEMSAWKPGGDLKYFYCYPELGEIEGSTDINENSTVDRKEGEGGNTLAAQSKNINTCCHRALEVLIVVVIFLSVSSLVFALMLPREKQQDTILVPT